MKKSHTLLSIVLLFLLVGCATPGAVSELEDLEPAAITPDSLSGLMPDYRENLQTMTGSGRALVSEPGNSDRVTVEFQSNRAKSLLTIRTAIGVEGGQILVESDSLLIYNKVDKIAQKISPQQSTLSSVGSIASLNMLDLFNFTIDVQNVDTIFEDQDRYHVLLKNQMVVQVEKQSGLVLRVDRLESASTAPYSSIQYEGYATIDRFELPRKITIFSGDGKSRATFLVQRLNVNGKLPPLHVDIPDDIIIQRP